jgi:hypothetical protein
MALRTEPARHGQHRELTAIRAVHTAIYLGLVAAIFYLLYWGVSHRGTPLLPWALDPWRWRASSSSRTVAAVRSPRSPDDTETRADTWATRSSPNGSPGTRSACSAVSSWLP